MATPLTAAASVSFFLDKNCTLTLRQTSAKKVQVLRSFSRTTVNCSEKMLSGHMSVKTNFLSGQLLYCARSTCFSIARINKYSSTHCISFHIKAQKKLQACNVMLCRQLSYTFTIIKAALKLCMHVSICYI